VKSLKPNVTDPLKLKASLQNPLLKGNSQTQTPTEKPLKLKIPLKFNQKTKQHNIKNRENSFEIE